MRKVRFTMAMLLIVMFFPAFAWSDEENRLTRDEVTVMLYLKSLV